MSSKLQNLLNLTIKTFYSQKALSTAELTSYFNAINLNEEIDLSFLNEDFSKDKEKSCDKNKLYNFSMYTKSDAPVLHMEIYEKPSRVSLTLFLIRKGFRIPFHNHPKMHGFIKLLHGSGTIDAYTLMSKTKKAENGAKIVTAKHEFCKKVAAQGGDVLTLEPNSCDIHEIQASSDSDLVFVDLIVPPYDGNCNYYEFISKSDNLATFKQLDEAPLEYFCDSLVYCGPKLSLDNQ